MQMVAERKEKKILPLVADVGRSQFQDRFGDEAKLFGGLR
jgi:hypothetical protein